MAKNKLMDILQNLSGHSRNRLEKFVHSPYHNTHPLVIKLADYMLQCEIFDMETAFGLLYPNEKYQAQKLRNVMSYFQKVLDKFLIYEALEADEVEQGLRLLEIYRKQNESKAYNTVRMNLEQLLEKASLKNANNLYTQFRLQEQVYAYEVVENRLSAKNVQQILDKLDAYYLANRLKYSIIAKSHEAVAKTIYNLGNMQALLQYSTDERWQQMPAVQLYRAVFIAFTAFEQTDYYFQFKELLLSQASLFDKHEQKDLYLLAINYCIRKTNAGSLNFIAELYDIYKDGLKQEIFIENGILSRFTFKNIVSVSLRLEEYAWTRDFIENYAGLLEPEYRNDYTCYNLAKWHQLTGDYAAALQLFQQISQRDILIHADTKISLVKIYYELEEYEPLDYLFESFKAFIHRNKMMSDAHKRSYLNFIKYAKKLVVANTKAKRKKLLEILPDVDNLPDKQWFLEQLE